MTKTPEEENATEQTEETSAADNTTTPTRPAEDTPTTPEDTPPADATPAADSEATPPAAEPDASPAAAADSPAVAAAEEEKPAEAEPATTTPAAVEEETPAPAPATEEETPAPEPAVEETPATPAAEEAPAATPAAAEEEAAPAPVIEAATPAPAPEEPEAVTSEAAAPVAAAPSGEMEGEADKTTAVENGVVNGSTEEDSRGGAGDATDGGSAEKAGDEPAAAPAPETAAAPEEPAASDGNTTEAAVNGDAPATTEAQEEPKAEDAGADGVSTATRPGTAHDDDYEDDFSEMSEKSDRGKAAGAAATTEEAPAVASEEAAAPVRKSPTPSVKDEPRSEAAAVVPVPVVTKRPDGRSLAEEGGETRGEDRNEAATEGGEDSRGQGQWKSEDDALMESSLSNQTAEKEALQKVIDEKVLLQKEFDVLKGRYLALEASGQQVEMEVGVLREKCQQQDARLKDLEASQAKLVEYEEWGRENDAKVKDLQGRLAQLAQEDADKDRKIHKLQEDLAESNSRLAAAERQSTVNSEAASRQQPVQQSKTCAVM